MDGYEIYFSHFQNPKNLPKKIQIISIDNFYPELKSFIYRIKKIANHPIGESRIDNTSKFNFISIEILVESFTLISRPLHLQKDSSSFNKNIKNLIEYSRETAEEIEIADKLDSIKDQWHKLSELNYGNKKALELENIAFNEEIMHLDDTQKKEIDRTDLIPLLHDIYKARVEIAQDILKEWSILVTNHSTKDKKLKNSDSLSNIW